MLMSIFALAIFWFVVGSYIPLVRDWFGGLYSETPDNWIVVKFLVIAIFVSCASVLPPMLTLGKHIEKKQRAYAYKRKWELLENWDPELVAKMKRIRDEMEKEKANGN